MIIENERNRKMFHIYADSMLTASKMEQFQHHPNGPLSAAGKVTRKGRKGLIRDLFDAPVSTILYNTRQPG